MAIQPHRLGTMLVILAATLLQAEAPVDRVVLHGDTPRATRLADPVGRPDPATPMDRMILTLKIAPEAQARLDTLLARQQDPASSSYHQWLTPEAFGQQFGPSPEALAAVLDWLRASGFSVEEVGAGRTTILFNGDVRRVEQAFQTTLLDYRLDGRAFHANASEPSIPAALQAAVQGVVSLHNLPRMAMNRGFRIPEFAAGNGANYMAPADFATIYNVGPLYAAGTTGSGVNLAIVGRTHIGLADVATFRSQFGLPANPPSVVVNGPDPGDLGGGEDGEAYLDVEWSGAVARNATITFVCSASTASTDGVDLSAQYIVNQNLAAVMSLSFGQGEAAMGTSENAFYKNLWAQAAAQGITVLVAAGDSGAAGSDSSSSASGTGGASVSGLASTPSNICVGGTEFNDAGGAYWSASNGAAYASALGYIPEAAWNESGAVAGGSGLWAGGGGASTLYAKPSWQVAPGVPADGRRDVPDVSLTAASHDGYLIQSGGALQAAGGTSCATPAFAGLMALVVQATGQRQGNANAVLYRLANAQYQSGGAAVFHDILSGSNSVPGVAGFLAGPGYDQATGLGSVDASALVANWSTAPANKVTAAIATPAASVTLASGAALTFTGTGTDSSATATLSYAWTFGEGGRAAGASVSHAFTNTGSANAVNTVTLTVKDSTGITATATRTVTVTPAPRNTVTATITAPSASVTLASGATQAFTGTGKDSSTAATLTYAWTFGDGATATGASASHAFTNSGTANAVNTVTLTVKDSTGITATATRTVTVTPAPRNTVTAAISAPAASVTLASGATQAFTGTGKDSSTAATLTYAWTFGDGSTATGASASHTFTNTGTANAVNTVTLTVKDSTGITATATRTVTVTPAPRNTVTAAISAPAAKVTLASGATQAFTGTGKDSSASATLAYTWTFGDGATATGASVSHTFTNTGTANAVNTVTLTVKDSTGISATATVTVTVTPAPPKLTATILTPAANVTVASGTTVTLTGQAVDTNAGATLSYSWTSSIASAAKLTPLGSQTTLSSTCAVTVQNTSGKAAVVTVTFKVTDSAGATATATRLVTVNPS